LWPSFARLLCNMNNGTLPSTPPKGQFVTDVLPPYHDFVAAPTLEHSAIAAANALAHFAEHVFVYYQHHAPSVLAGTTRAADFVSYLARTEQHDELDIIWDLSLASKHRFLDRPASRQRHITGAIEAFLPGATAPLRLVLQDGRQPLIADVLEAAVRFWQRWLP